MRKATFCMIVIAFLQLFFLLLNAQDFTFALLTDIHISKNPTAIDDLRNSIKSVNENPDIQFVIVSGDITEEGDKHSLEQAKLELDKLNVRYYITSGNHETKWSESGVTDFGHIFGSDRFEFNYNGYSFLGFNSGPIIRMMDGHVGKQDIVWLKNKLDSIGQEPVIIITHYPLQNGDVDNWYQVTDLLRNYNVKVILGGHYHKNQQTNYDGIPAFINRSNLRNKEKVGGYSIYNITPDSIIVSEQVIGEKPLPWGGFSLTEKYYDIDASQYYRPSFAVNSEFPNVKEVWVSHINGAIYSSPTIYKDKVFTGDDLGNMLCFSAKTGKLLWNFKTNNRILGTATVKDNIVVFGSTDHFIYGVNTNNGKLIWKYLTGKAVMGGASVEGDIAYIGGSDNCFYAIDIKTGSPKWIFDGVKGYIETVPLIYKNAVYFGAWDNNMYALNKTDGKLLWKWNGDLTRMHFSPAAVWPVATNDKIFFTAPDRVMTAVDANTGETVWRTKESMVRETIGLSEDQTRLYSKTMQDSVVCYSAIDNEPKRLWITNVGYGYDHAPSMPLEKGGTVFGSTKNGIIFALNGKTGELLWKHKVGNSLINTIIPLNSKECIFASAEGVIGKLRSEE